jgi:putative FmdB family regulatory protein
MPVYEFECKCGHIFEDLVRMDTKTSECPHCKKQAKKSCRRVPLNSKEAVGTPTDMLRRKCNVCLLSINQSNPIQSIFSSIWNLFPAVLTPSVRRMIFRQEHDWLITIPLFRSKRLSSGIRRIDEITGERFGYR